MVLLIISPLGEEIIKMGNNKVILIFGILILVGIISLVNAATITSGCCERTTGGAWCQDAPANCDSGFRVSTEACDDPEYGPDWCEAVNCFDPDEGLCSPGTRALCTSEGGEPKSYNEEICKEGCCYLGTRTEFITQARCEILGERRGIDTPEFDSGVSEEDCRTFTQDEGACVVGESCDITPDEFCVRELGGEFYEGVFCSNPEFNLSYAPRDHKGCVAGKDDVYWFDDHNNKEGVAEACDDGEETCALVSGEYTCKSISCTDEDGNEREDGESWCVYDGHVGEFSTDIRGRYDILGGERIYEIDEPIHLNFSSDTVGSEHYLFYCNQGEIKLGGRSEGRNLICAEKIENGTSKAIMRQNLGEECLDIDNVEECSLNKDCRIQSVDLGEQFNFKVCVPRFPLAGNPFDGDIIFRIGCYSAFNNGGKCIANCDCENSEFLIQLNNLCTSIGDGGGYINYVGRYTPSFRIDDRAWFTVCSQTRNLDDLEEKYGDYNNYNDLEQWCMKYWHYIGNSYTHPETMFTSILNGSKNEIGVNTPFFRDFGRPKRIETTGIKIIGLQDWMEYVHLPEPDDRDNPQPGESDVEEDDDWGLQFFTCKPWTPPSGGADCEKCGENPLNPCTDYRCESLGSSCQVLDETRNNENPLCVNRFSNDTDPPEITFTGVEGKDLQSRDYTYSETSLGVNITTASGCPEQYSDLTFTYETNERAKCIVLRNSSADVTRELESENQYLLEHEAEVNLNDDDNMRLYVICQDGYGWYNQDELVVDICVSPTPDTRAPVIKRFEPESGSYFKFGGSNISIKAILNEPAECKYSTSPGTNYDTMSSKLSCNMNQPDAVIRFCQGILNLVPGENKFYVKCRDLVGNTNVNDYIYTLKETPTPLTIKSVSPADGEIRREEITRENPLVLKAETAGGVDNGISVCKYKFPSQGYSDTFTTTNSTTHKYTITSNLSEGNYTMEITCTDKVGNEAKSTTVFFLDIDRTPPAVVRAYYDSGSLVLITNEDAKCYYNDINACSPFSVDSLRSMETGYTREHSVAWDKEQTYYIKCIDLNGNPNPSCAIIVKPGE